MEYLYYEIGKFVPISEYRFSRITLSSSTSSVDSTVQVHVQVVGVPSEQITLSFLELGGEHLQESWKIRQIHVKIGENGSQDVYYP